MAMKTLINRTGNDLKVTLVVRNGETPGTDFGTVDVHLAAATAGSAAEAGGSCQQVQYGDDTDVYLNGIEMVLIKDGAGIGKREVVVERGSSLDDRLNTRDTIEFLFDGKQVLWSSSNADAQPESFMFAEMKQPDKDAG